jgi:hypothetical protein
LKELPTEKPLKRVGNKPNAKNRLASFAQQFYMPRRLLFEIAHDPADEIAADVGHLRPGGGTVGALRAMLDHAGVITAFDFEEI